MAVAAGQICAERFYHTSVSWYVYQPTGNGDWYRWRLSTASQVMTGADASYPAPAGCVRGQVYAGAQKTPAESDANSGFTTTAAAWGNTGYSTTDYTHYRDFNVPEGMTHVRLFIRSAASGADLVKLTAYADTAALASTTYDSNIGTGLAEMTWYALPTGTTKVRVHKATNDSAAIRLCGLDWINKNSVVDPDTAGSVMWAGDDVPGCQVIYNGLWNQQFFANPQSSGMAIYWSDDGGAYSASNSVGGMGHRGINTATIAWTTQTGTDDPATWAPNQGDRLACDYLIETISTAKVYREAACTNYRGTLTGSYVFDMTGLQIALNYAVDQGTDMDVFDCYNIIVSFPLDVRYVYFHGDSTVYPLVGASKLSSLKTPCVELWGGPNGTHYRIEHHQSDTNMAYHKLTTYSAWPRIAFVDSTPDYYKIYSNYYSNTTTPLDVADGTTLSTRFAIRLHDKRLSQKRIRRLL